MSYSPLDGAALRAQRQALGLTQLRLAELLGYTPTTIARWERGEQPIGHPERVASALKRLGSPEVTDPSARLVLPNPTSSFIGRAASVLELRQNLAMSRLLTLTGAGGIGKTRLAIEVAREVRPEYSDGVAFIALAPLSDSAWVVPTIAASLGVREEADRSLVEHVLAIVASRRMLIVLDNCEHVVQAAADFCYSVLQCCESVRILATSREPLRVPGEQTYALAPLSLPEPGTLELLADAGPSEAVQLFVQRARESTPDFALSPANATSVATICRRLDGIPLALEIAASRVAVLDVDDIAARLDNRFELLRGGSRVSPARHQTLAATVQWSYDLLSRPEQVFFECVSELAVGRSRRPPP